MRNYAVTHPGTREDEFFLGYYNEEEYKIIPYTTKRKGILGYYPDGTIFKPSEKKFPAFIKLYELQQKKIDVTSIKVKQIQKDY